MLTDRLESRRIRFRPPPNDGKNTTMNPRIYLSIIVLIFSLPVAAQVAWKDRVNVSVLVSAPAKPADANIAVLTSEPSDRSTESLCMITATGGQTIKGSKTGLAMIEPVKKKARECGADAVVIRAVSDQTIKPLRGGIDQGARLDVVAIRYTDDQ